MIEQTATVIDIDGDLLVLETQPESSCHSCSVKKGCGTSVLSGFVGNKLIHFTLPNTLAARKGDRVVLGLPEHAMVKGSTVVYVMPLLVMIAVAVLADHTLALDADKRDLSIAVLSLASLAMSTLLARWLFRNAATRQAYTPVLLRKEITSSTLAH